jgi:hypothetical protein
MVRGIDLEVDREVGSSMINWHGWSVVSKEEAQLRVLTRSRSRHCYHLLHKYGVVGLVCRYNIRYRVKEGRKAD